VALQAYEPVQRRLPHRPLDRGGDDWRIHRRPSWCAAASDTDSTNAVVLFIAVPPRALARFFRMQ
jgi:hypothetical protein